MAQNVQSRIGQESGFIDPETGDDLLVLKAVDITEECPQHSPSGPVVLLYTMSPDEQMVIVEGTCPDLSGEPWSRLFSVSALSREIPKTSWLFPSAFHTLANGFGITVEKLRELILEHAL